MELAKQVLHVRGLLVKDPVCLIDFNDIVSHRNDDQSCEETTRGTNSKPNLGLRKGN